MPICATDIFILASSVSVSEGKKLKITVLRHFWTEIIRRQAKRQHQRFNSSEVLSDPDFYEKKGDEKLMVLGESELITFNTDLQWDDELDKFVEVPLPM